MFEIVDRDYVMNPETEKQIDSGAELQDGMVVLIASRSARWLLEGSEPSDMADILETNRWCTVSNVQVRTGSGIDMRTGDPKKMVGFTAIYEDGATIERWYHVSNPWYVKLDSCK